MKLEFHPSTTTDLNEAIKYYNELRPVLGKRFRSEVYDAIARIQNNPLAYSEIKGVRRAMLSRFPYSIIYRLVDNQTIRILLIRHHRRHPGHESRRN